MKTFVKAICVLLVTILTFGAISMTAFAQDTHNTVDKNLVKLPAEIMKSKSVYNYTDIIVSEEDNCFYTISNDALFRYDFESGEYEKFDTYTFERGTSIKSRYVADDKVYLLVCDTSWSDSDPYCSRIMCFDLKTHTMVTVFEYEHQWLTAVGVDELGRIYLSGEKYDDEGNEYRFIRITDSTGKALDEITIEDQVFSFAGFDEERGFFFTVSYTNFRYWGYDHDCNALRVGSINENNEIYYDPAVVMTISQRYFYDRPKEVEVLGNDFFAIDSSFYSTFYVIPLDTFKPGSGQMDVTASIERGVNSAEFDNCGALGTRCVYFKENDSLIFSTDSKSIMECNPNTGEVEGEFTTQHDVYAIYTFGENILLFEKDGEDFYYSIVEIKRAQNIYATPDEITIEVGESYKINASVDGTYTPEFVWESENPLVATVSSNGTVVGWKAGTTTIKISANNLPVTYVKVNVTANASFDESAFNSNNQLTTRIGNEGRNSYYLWASTVKSYLNENKDGTFTAVYAGDDKVFIDVYSSDFNTLINTIELEYPLGIFGGYYSGEKYNYLVFGDKNMEESDTKEVIRVQKYSKNFELIDSLSLYGENTTIPFDGGSLRMVEAGNLLYVHTCHEMYADETAVNHQANLSFVADTETMEVTDIFSDVLNIDQAGYVSHSFNQFITKDDEYIYRVDHGDASPRGASIVKTPIGDDITDVIYAVPVSFEGGYGQNYTGASIGGLECSEENVLIAGNIYSDPENITSCTKNVFLSVTPKTFHETDRVYLTDLEKYGDVTAMTPHLVKINDEQFVMMWEEYNQSEYTYITKVVAVNSAGVLASEIIEIPYRLSDCKPILASDYTIKWIVSDDRETTLCSINPFKLDEVEEVIKAQTPDPEETTSPSEDNTEHETQPTEPTYPTYPVPPESPDNTEVPTNPDYTVSTDCSEEPESSTAPVYSTAPTQTDPSESEASSTAENTTQSETEVPEDKGVLGDVSGDGKVNIKDATIIQKSAAKILTLTETEILRANVNGDAKVNVKDATAVQKYLAKIPTGYPIGEKITG